MVVEDTESHRKRIDRELRRVCATERGIKQFSKRSIYDIIHPEEHIMGAVYGRYGAGSFNWYAGMLVATDRRMLFFDLTPGVTDFTELTYDIITGIQHLTVGPFASIMLYTGIRDYNLRFTSPDSANVLVHYVEKRRLEKEVVFDPNIYEMQDDYQDEKAKKKGE